MSNCAQTAAYPCFPAELVPLGCWRQTKNTRESRKWRATSEVACHWHPGTGNPPVSTSHLSENTHTDTHSYRTSLLNVPLYVWGQLQRGPRAISGITKMLSGLFCLSSHLTDTVWEWKQRRDASSARHAVVMQTSTSSVPTFAAHGRRRLLQLRPLSLRMVADEGVDGGLLGAVREVFLGNQGGCVWEREARKMAD